MSTLGDVTAPKIDQGGPSEVDEFIYVDISSIDNKLKRIVGPKRLATSAAPSRARQRLKAGDVLVSMTRPNLNAVAIVPPELDGSVGSTGFHVLRAQEGVEPRWLFNAVQTRDFVETMSSFVQGALYPAVRPKDIRSFDIHLPTIEDQRKILDEIETQFSRLDEAVANLKRVKSNLKRYKAGVLKAAVEGLLVPTEAELACREGRAFDAASQLFATELVVKAVPKRAGRLWGSGHVPQLTHDEVEGLPDGWVWTKVRDLGYSPEDAVQVGPMSMKSSEFIETGVPVLNVGCVQWGYFDESKLDHLPLEVAMRFERYRIQPGDVLFTRSGTVGRCAVAQAHQRNWLMTFHLLRVRPDPNKCLPGFLRSIFEGASHVRRQTREASIGSTRAGFNTNLLAMLDVPLPPIAEQERIVAEVDRRLSLLRGVEAEVDANLERAERLRHAVLAGLLGQEMRRA